MCYFITVVYRIKFHYPRTASLADFGLFLLEIKFQLDTQTRSGCRFYRLIRMIFGASWRDTATRKVQQQRRR